MRIPTPGLILSLPKDEVGGPGQCYATVSRTASITRLTSSSVMAG
jgi:hypothetical protein